jgi:hydrogenase expression/formation protein HypE
MSGAGGRAPAGAGRSEVVTLADGAGGKASRRLVDGLFLEELRNPLLEPLEDAAIVGANGARIAVTTDSYVVRPLRFPGGDIGELAVNGTVNDLAVSGAVPLALTAGFVLEEGFPLDELRALVASMASAARAAGVAVAAGDTKVVERGAADGLYVTTAGFGLLDLRALLGLDRVRAGDRVLLSGGIAEHGIAVMLARGNLELELDVESDTAPLSGLSAELCSLGSELRWMRDPTRGGLATTLNELATGTGLSVVFDEQAVPVRDDVRAACELLGIDPLSVANEGKLVAVVSPDAAERALALARAHPLGAQAALVGELREDSEPFVLARTPFGTRIVDMLVGDPLPRIC